MSCFFTLILCDKLMGLFLVCSFINSRSTENRPNAEGPNSQGRRGGDVHLHSRGRPGAADTVAAGWEEPQAGRGRPEGPVERRAVRHHAAVVPRAGLVALAGRGADPADRAGEGREGRDAVRVRGGERRRGPGLRVRAAARAQR